MRKTTQRSISFYLCFAMALPGQGQGSAAPAPTQDPAAISKAAERCIDAAALLARDLPRDTFDLHAVLDGLGREPEQLFAFVRDKTWWIAYAGSLRGELGVLMDRLGNSLDRALLLASLLRMAGHDARLAHATLSPERAKELAAAIASPPAQRITRSAEDTAKTATDLAAAGKQLGFSPAELEKAKESGLRERAAFTDAAATRTKAQVRELMSLLGDSKPAAAPAVDAAAMLADHWWVQVEKAGAWIDLDPLLSKNTVGAKLAEASETLPFTAGKGFVLPAELRHRQRISVKISVLANGALTEHEVLSHEMIASELLGQPIALAFRALDWPTDDSLFTAGDPAAKLREILVAQKEWLPTLRIGERFVTQKSFTNGGDVVAAPKLDPTARMGSGIAKKIGGIGDLFDGLGAEPPKAKAKSELVAVHVDHELLAPRAEPVRDRRTLVDVGKRALDDAVHHARALALMHKVNLLPVCCELSPEFVLDTAANQMLANKALLRGITSAAQANDTAKAGKLLGQLRPVPSLLPVLALLRQQHSRAGGALVVDRLQLLAEEAGFALVQNAMPSARVSFDIVANRFGVLPSAAGSAAELLLAQGVLDTTLEALARDRSKPTENTGELMAASATQKVAWNKITTGDDPLLGKLDAKLAEELRAELARGNVVVAPERMVAVAGKQLYGWWRIDPKSGTTLGVMQGGRGQSAVEYAILCEVVGLAAFVGCAGANPNANSGAKNLGCAICAVIAVVAAITALGWAPAAAFGLAGAAANGAGAVVSGVGCSLLGAYAS